MNQRATATIDIVTTCQREGCGVEHKAQRVLDLGPWDHVTPIRVKPDIPPGWHSIDRRCFCSIECMAIVIAEAIARKGASVSV